MGLFDDESPIVEDTKDQEPSANRGRPIIVVLLLLGIGVGGYFGIQFMRPADELPVAERTIPTPEPELEPRFSEPPPPPPRRAPAPKPTPEVVAEPEPPPTPPTGMLRVESDVPAAMVFLDRAYLGTTPIEVAELTPGPHTLNVSAQGYDGFSQSVDITEEPIEIIVKFREVRLDATVLVTHKHRMGSCEGQLVANIQGIHYETPHNDAFSIPLLEIDEFEIDYLDHNLKLKQKDGRTYNFTDDFDNADNLFVFHRDVESARTRLSEQD